jgi:iron complex outermembrane recepter protein
MQRTFCLVFSAGLACITQTVRAQSNIIELPHVQITDRQSAPGSTLSLDAPNATGSRLGLTARETPASVSSLGAADIAERSLTRAQDVAVRMPGITEAPAPGNGGTSLAARGFSGHSSVAQMVDGTRLIVASGTITYPFSTWPMEWVEVLRGPASVLYGDGAIGAAVNYVTKRPSFASTQREAFVGVGSYGTVQGGVGLRGPINDVLAYSVYLDAEKSDGYREFMDVKRQNYALALAARASSDLNVTLSLDGGVNDDARYFGTPLRNGVLDERLRRTNFNVSDSVVKYDDRVWRAKVDYRAAADVRLRNETYHLTTHRHWRNAEDYSFDTTGAVVQRDDYLEILHDQEQTGNRFDTVFDGHLGGMKNRFIVGLDWYRTKLIHTNNSPYGGSSTVDPFDFTPGSFISPVPTTPGRSSKLETTALFAENALDLTKEWKLVAGLRSDRMELDTTNLRTGVNLVKKYSPVTGRLGAVWSLSDALSLYGQFATGTDPLSGALSLPGGGNTFDLTKGRQAEVGAKGAVPAMHGEWTVALYKIEKRNLLSRDASDPTVTHQIGQQSSTGIELAFAAEPLRGWTLDANTAFLHARYDDFKELVSGALVSRDGKTPTGVPQRTASIWTAYRFQPRWQAGFGARYVGERQGNTANTTQLPSYAVLDASLAHELSRDLKLALSVKNLANRDYAVSGSAGTSWLLGAPRTVALTIRANF